MVVEVWEWDQPWPISLPQEPERNRPLVARNTDGTSRRWSYFHAWETWRAEGKTWGNSWTEIVNQAMRHGWTLVSLPPETGDPA